LKGKLVVIYYTDISLRNHNVNIITAIYGVHALLLYHSTSRKSGKFEGREKSAKTGEYSGENPPRRQTPSTGKSAKMKRQGNISLLWSVVTLNPTSTENLADPSPGGGVGEEGGMGWVGDTHTDRCVGLGNRGFSIRPARNSLLLHSYSSLFDLHLGSNCGAEAARRERRPAVVGGGTRAGRGVPAEKRCTGPACRPCRYRGDSRQERERE